jgi:hypothetical protein
MPANQNEPINIAGKVVFSNPGIPQLAPAANQQIVRTGAEASSGVPTQDALRNVSGQCRAGHVRIPTICDRRTNLNSARRTRGRTSTSVLVQRISLSSGFVYAR